MKRITFSGVSIVTGNAIAEAILEYTTAVADAENSVTVDITVLEDNGETSIHTLLLSPSAQFDVADVGGLSAADEAARFPVPAFPQVGIIGLVETGDQPSREADEVDAIMRDIDNDLEHDNG
jgi:hypothetical protein